jgi:exodeoxyribonuclease VII large subunit
MIGTGKEFISKAVIVPSYLKSRLISAVGLFSSGKYMVLERKSLNMINLASNILKNNKLKTDSFESSLNILDPANVLRRGYSITSLNGKIIKSSGDVSEEDIIDTRLSDGTIKSKVI